VKFAAEDVSFTVASFFRKPKLTQPFLIIVSDLLRSNIDIIHRFRQNFAIVVVSQNMTSNESLRFLNIAFITTMKIYVGSFKYFRDAFLKLHPFRCLVVCPFISEANSVTSL